MYSNESWGSVGLNFLSYENLTLGDSSSKIEGTHGVTEVIVSGRDFEDNLNLSTIFKQVGKLRVSEEQDI